jgi:hypothetical protein
MSRDSAAKPPATPRPEDVNILVIDELRPLPKARREAGLLLPADVSIDGLVLPLRERQPSRRLSF